MRKKDQNGQVMPFLCVIFLIMFMSFFFILNIGKLFHHVMEVQNTADNVALSVGAYRARVLNFLGQCNRKIAACLYGGPLVIPLYEEMWKSEDPMVGIAELGITNYDGTLGYVPGTWGACAQVGLPILPMCITNSQKNIASVADMSHGGCSGTDWGINKSSIFIETVKGLVAVLKTAQDMPMLSYPVVTVFLADKVAKENIENATVTPLPTMFTQLFWNGFTSLGLERNDLGIQYKKTESFCASCPPFPFIPPWHTHFCWSSNLSKDESSWLYANKKEFDQSHKLWLMVQKKFKGSSSLFQLKQPVFTAFAAASTYNLSGPMFPQEETDAIREVFTAYNDAKDHNGWKAHLIADPSMLELSLTGG